MALYRRADIDISLWFLVTIYFALFALYYIIRALSR